MTTSDMVSWMPRKALIGIISSIAGVLFIIGLWWVSSTNTACADNKCEIIIVKEKQKSTDDKFAEIMKKLDRIEDRLDRRNK